MTEVHEHFRQPSSRLQLLIFLNLYISDPTFQSKATFQQFPSILAKHELTASLLMSLLVDNSTTVCNVGLTVLAKLLPMFAKHACEDLKSMLPRLLAILARMMCWVERPPPPIRSGPDDGPDEKEEQELEAQISVRAMLRDDIEWTRLEMTFDATRSFPPSPRRYFTMLYYLFPCNVIRFLRKPFKHLADTQLESPYTIGWEEVLKERELRVKSEALLRVYACHPFLVRRDALQELSMPDVWTEYDVARMASEAVLLDLGNTAPRGEVHRSDDTGTQEQPTLVDLPGIPNTSLDRMITASIALKAGAPKRSSTTSPVSDLSASPSSQSTSPSKPHSDPSDTTWVPEGLLALQREAILLRNELNFELWLSRQTAQHLARLYVDRNQSKHDEAEWQALYNKLRNYRTQVTQLGQDLQDQKNLLASERGSMGEWKTELQSKLRELRAEKKTWIAEAAALRTAHQEVQAMLAAQGKLLAESTTEVFKLQTQQRETQHKIDRLRDYERQIEQHIKMQRLWDDDFQKFNERAEELKQQESRYRQLELRLQSFENSQTALLSHHKSPSGAQAPVVRPLTRKSRTTEQANFLEKQLTLLEDEKVKSEEARRKLREENMELREEGEEMRAMIELLKGQVAKQKGVMPVAQLPDPA
ncbi:hypothetical protein HGRIS_013186 [Hohenbuehelia grisea]|uniref:Hamartin n=1 Tax=Hohenbuehelia grisea TaxID=104357 RepID=A0ABR3IUU5_9AGAR